MSERDQYDLSSFIDPDLMQFAHLDLVSRDTFNGTPDPLIEVSTVPELTALAPFPGGSEFSSQNILADLEGIRAEMPFIPVAQWPSTIRTVVLGTAGIAADLNIPSGVVLAKFSATADFFVSHQNRAAVPGAGVAQDGFGGILNPTWTWWYVGGLKQLSVVSSVDNAIVQMVAMSPKAWPQR